MPDLVTSPSVEALEGDFVERVRALKTSDPLCGRANWR